MAHGVSKKEGPHHDGVALHLVLPTTPNPAGHYPTDTPPACEAVLDLVPPIALANLLCHVPGLPGAQHLSLHLKCRDGLLGGLSGSSVPLLVLLRSPSQSFVSWSPASGSELIAQSRLGILPLSLPH